MRKLGRLVDRTHRELSDEEVAQVAATYHAWRGDGDAPYSDMAGFCKSTILDEIRAHGHVLTPGRYVGAAEIEDDGEQFEEKMARLTTDVAAQFAESATLEETIRRQLTALGVWES